MQIDGIIIFDSVSGLPLFSKLVDDKIDDTLFSGFASAIRQFSDQLSLGGLSSFVTEEKIIFLAARSRIITAIIAPVDLEYKKVYSLAYRIGEKFEQTYELVEEVPDQAKFRDFNEIIDKTLKEEEIPFLIQATEFARKEFGGAVSVQPKLQMRGGQLGVIDIVVDRGEKKSSFRGKLFIKLRKLTAFSEDLTFIKVVDGVAGRGEVMDFLDSLKEFGDDRDESTEEFPFFPSRGVVIARDFSPTVFEGLEKIQRFGGKAALSGDHVTRRAKLKAAPDVARCFIELWKWKEDYPERVFS
ncbi:MAG: hypothetical protein ACFFD4_06625 [Candidatus Odinarchaeota archaeon]